MKNINFRYNIIEKLGEGATGRVYRVEDLMHGGINRALKTIRLEATGLKDASILRNEFSILRQFEHANIVKVYDFGSIIQTDLDDNAGDFFFTLDLVSGSNLFDATSHADNDLLFSMAFQIAHAIDYIHRNGLIHFDIKPENIIVSQVEVAGETVYIPKIIDFGFASAAIDLFSGGIKGSLHYLAPELIAGGTFDHRVDLYSFGVTLFQILARRLPFDSDDPVVLLKKHGMEAPPLSELRPDVPPMLAELVSGLMEKEPHRRIQSAKKVVDMLRPAILNMKALDNYSTDLPAKKFVGRLAELERLNRLKRPLHHSSPSELVKNAPHVMCIVGEKGIGKTPLVDEWRRLAQVENVLTFGAQCYVRSSPPLDAFRGILHELRFALLPYCYPSNTFLKRFDQLCSPFTGIGGDDENKSIPFDFSNEEGKKKFLTSLADIFMEASAIVPFVVVIDEIEEADEMSLELIRLLARPSVSCGPGILLCCNEMATVEKDLHLLQGEVDIIILNGIEDKDIVELVKSRLDIVNVPVEIASAISKTVGNSPYIVGEFLNQFTGFSSEKALTELSKALREKTAAREFPHTINQVYERRLQRCTAEQQSLLKAISCFRTPVEKVFLEKLQLHLSFPLSHLLTTLTMMDLLKASDDGNKCYFSQASFRWFVNENLPETESFQLHRMIAEVLEAQDKNVNEEELGYHYKRAGVKRKAYEHYKRAAEISASTFSLRESIELFEESIALASEEAERDAALLQIARQCDLVEDYEKAEKMYVVLLTRPNVEHAEKYSLLKSLGSVQTRRGMLENAVESFTTASKQARTSQELMAIEDELTDIDIARGFLSEARGRCTRLLQSFDLSGDDGQISSLYTKLGIISFYESKYDESTEHFLKAFTILEPSHDKAKLIAPLLNLGNAYSVRDELAKAAESWTKALQYAKEVGNFHQQGQIHNNLGIAEYNQGHFHTALEHYTEGVAIFRGLDNVPGEALCLNNAGEVYFGQSHYEKALEAWQRCLKLYSVIGDAQGLTECHCHLSQIYVSFEDIDAAEKHTREAEQIIGRGNLEAKRSIYYLSCTLVALAKKEFQAAENYARLAEGSFSRAGNGVDFCRLLLITGRVRRALDLVPDAMDSFTEARRRSHELSHRALEAEALLELGCMAKTNKNTIEGSPINYLKDVYNILESESVTDITWKVCYELGKEYSQRGMRSREKEFYAKAKQALVYLGSLFGGSTLREKFWKAGSRRLVLHECEAVLNGLTEGRG